MAITLAAAAVVRDDDGRFLLVLRADPPEAGRWSIPGGKVIPGETLAAAAAREVREETGVTVRIDRELGTLDRADGRGGSYEIHDFSATYVSGEVVAADDAAAAGWFTAAEVARLPLTRDLIGALTSFGVYP